ncbi:MAG: hypothetical protein AAF466_01435 [Bacteroidota bacterium]
MNSLKSIFQVLGAFTLVLFFSGCQAIYFHKPMPPEGETIRELPEFFEGTFKEDGTSPASYYNLGTTFMDVEFLNKTHCLVYTYSENVADSITAQISRNEDVISAEIKGTTLIITKADTVQMVKNLTLIKPNIVRSPRELIFEIDLERGVYIDREQKDKQPTETKILLKADDDAYYFNMLNDTVWTTTVLKDATLYLGVTFSAVNTKDYKKNEAYYNGITDIEKIGSRYYARPTQSEFMTLMTEPKLTSKVLYSKVKKTTDSTNEAEEEDDNEGLEPFTIPTEEEVFKSVLIYIGLIFLGLLAIVALIIYLVRRNKSKS